MTKRGVISLVIISLAFSIISCEKIVAKGEGWKITKKEFKERIEALSPEQSQLLTSEESKKKYLENLALGEILYHEAKKEGILDNPEVARRAEEARREVIINEFLRKKLEGELAPSDTEIDEFYSQNKDAFDNAGTIRVSHILVETKEEAEKIKKLLDEGEKFEEIAKKNSIDTFTAPYGGDLNYFNRGDMVPEFEAAAFSLKKPGEISPIIQTKFGFHIIKLIDKDQLFEKFVYEKRDEIIMSYFEKIKEESKYETFPENLITEE